VVGKLRRPHGVKGEVLVNVLSDFPERLQPGTELFLGEKHQPVIIQSRREHNQGLLIAFEGFASREDLDNLRNIFLYVRSADRPELGEGEFYHHQLIGMTVAEEDGNELGRLAEILETGANDVYLVRSATGDETLLPAIEDVIVKVDVESQQITVRLLPGLKTDPNVA
jgi:16S rRNA processing protein RimM